MASDYESGLKNDFKEDFFLASLSFLSIKKTNFKYFSAFIKFNLISPKIFCKTCSEKY